jgi:hypothetical protein
MASGQLHGLLLYPPHPKKKSPGTQWVGGWVRSRIGLDDMEKCKCLTYLDSNPEPICSARSQSLYRINYPSSFGRAVAQVVRHRFPTAAARVPSLVRSCGICGRFSPSTSISPAIHSTVATHTSSGAVQ